MIISRQAAKNKGKSRKVIDAPLRNSAPLREINSFIPING